MSEPSPYRELEKRFARLGKLQDAAAMLHWDLATMMPEGGAAARAEQLASLRVVCHEMLTDPALAALLDRAAGDAGALDAWQRANLAEMRRDWIHAAAMGSDLVEALSRATSRCEMVWRKARPDGDFAAILPCLKEVLALVREQAAAKAARLGTTPYDALLDEYEPGGRAAAIDPVFDDLAAFLPEFLGKVLERQASREKPIAPSGRFPAAAQRQLGEKLMAALGFEFSHGRLDVSAHPFCGGVPDDVRITTRYNESDFASGLMGVLHETGHALYERGLPKAWRHQPVGRARGMSVHESQSLLFEMQACRSRPFIDYVAPLARAAFGGEGPAWEADNLQRHYLRVEPGFIRVDADEVTYPAHVILRYRLEKAMIAGDLALTDLPGAWAEGMRGLLGIVPPDDRLGCLQDIHWYDGAWGYFPTYTLGAMTAAQLFAAAVRDEPAIPAAIGRGDFSPLLGWLRRHVHGHGSSLPAEKLLSRATGAPLDPGLFKAHLRTRYLA